MNTSKIKTGIVTVVLVASFFSLAARPAPQDDDLQKCNDDCQKQNDECMKNCIDNAYNKVTPSAMQLCTDQCASGRSNCLQSCKSRSYEPPSRGTESFPILRKSLIFVRA
jgi:hypothetical protein